MLYLGAMIGFFFYTTQYLQGVLGFSPLQAGIAFLPMSAVNFAVAVAVTGSVGVPLSRCLSLRTRRVKRIFGCAAWSLGSSAEINAEPAVLVCHAASRAPAIRPAVEAYETAVDQGDACRVVVTVSVGPS